MTPRGRHTGLTLVEVLVVLLVVGVMAAVVTLSLGGGHDARELRREADRLAALVQLAREDAVLKGRNLALAMEPDGYRFLVRGADGWYALEGDRVLRPRSLPPRAQPALELEGRPATLASDPREPRAHVMLLAGGEMTPFVLELGTGAPRYRITGGAFGDIEVEAAE